MMCVPSNNSMQRMALRAAAAAGRFPDRRKLVMQTLDSIIRLSGAPGKLLAAAAELRSLLNSVNYPDEE